MIYSVARRDQFSRQGRRLLCVATRAERAFLQADPFQRSLAKRFKSCSFHWAWSSMTYVNTARQNNDGPVQPSTRP